MYWVINSFFYAYSSCYIVYNSKDEGKEKLIARIEDRLGANIIKVAEEDGTGTSEYELINIY